MNNEVRLMLFGDICPTPDYEPLFRAGAEALLHDVLPLIRDADLAVCNLECPATAHNSPIVKTGPNLRAEPETLAMLKSAGFHAVSLANNHILDHGVKGVSDTLALCKKHDIAYFGGGENAQEAARPLFLEAKGLRIGFLSFAEHEFNLATEQSPGANLFDPYISLSAIRSAKENCDFLVVLYHGGIEHYIYPSPLLQKKCRAMIDAGADFVSCQHSHCIGTYEEYQNKTILYGQGNSVFGYREGDASWNEGWLVELSFSDKTEIRYHLLSARKDGIYLNRNDAERTARFEEESANLSKEGFIQSSWNTFCRKKAPWYLPMLLGWGRIGNKLNRLTKGRLLRLFKSRKALMISTNLLHCDAHMELSVTALEQTQKED